MLGIITLTLAHSPQPRLSRIANFASAAQGRKRRKRLDNRPIGGAQRTQTQVPANARLGLLLVLGLVNCFIASMLLLPVLLHRWPLKDFEEAKTGELTADSPA
jgi:hypothetical protein